MHKVIIIFASALSCCLLSFGCQATSAKPKVLNNLVTELVSVASIPATPAYQEISFTNPREGWVFVAATTRLDISGQAVENDDIVKISIDGDQDEAVLNYRFGDATTKETMRYLTAGGHTLRIWFPEKPEMAELNVRNLVVRAVPALVYCAHPVVSTGYYGVYDSEFLAKDVLPNINTIVGEGALRYEDLHKEWKDRGGQWYIEQNLPSLLRKVGALKDVPKPLTADYTYDYWTKSQGFTNPYLDGVFADEFMWVENQIPDFPAYGEAIKRIAASDKFKDKKVNGWTFGKEMYTEPAGKVLLQAFISSGCKIVWEFYPGEPPTQEAMREHLYGNLGETIKDWEKNIPGMAKHVIFTSGYFCAPPMSLNDNPAVDFKVQLDMQLNYLANAPECLGLYGFMAWKSRYADEEIVRWTGRLLRHYGIKGKRNLLSDELGFKYQPGHITNPDFNDGLDGWSVAAATPDSVQTGTMAHLSEMQGRFGDGGHGDNYLLTRRSAEKPNKVSQEIKNLSAGKLYSAKLYVADYQDYLNGESVRKRLEVSFDIDNVKLVPEKCLLLEVDISSSGLSSVGPFKGKTPPWMNVHRLVFRALGTTAKLIISDWMDKTTPGGSVGQEIIYNFVEVGPYIED